MVLVSVLSQQQKVSEHINYDSIRQEDEVPNTFIYIIYLALMLINFSTIFQNFIHVYNKTWLYPLPLILFRCSHIPSICSTPNFNIFVFSNINNHVHMWMGWGHFLEYGKHTQNEWFSILQQLPIYPHCLFIGSVSSTLLSSPDNLSFSRFILLERL